MLCPLPTTPCRAPRSGPSQLGAEGENSADRIVDLGDVIHVMQEESRRLYELENSEHVK